MHLSLSNFCHLCATPSDGASLTNIYSERGKQERLQALINQYITPLIFLPKNDKLCVCDTCKTRLQTWDSFIDSCKTAQEKLKDAGVVKKRQIDSIGVGEIPSTSCPKKKRSSNYCIARWCNKGNHQGISLFRLPKERERALRWLSAAERTDLQNMSVLHSYYLCANHFTSNMFTNKACNQLIKKATPTVFPRPLYADKIALKAAAFQVLPTQLQGVQLKSILPKITSPNSVPSTHHGNMVISKTELSADKIDPQSSGEPIVIHLLPQWTQEKALQKSEENSGLVLKVVSSELPSPSVTTHDNVIHVINSIPITSTLQNSNIAVLLNDDRIPFVSSSINYEDTGGGLDNINLAKSLNCIPSSNLIAEGESALHCSLGSPSHHEPMSVRSSSPEARSIVEKPPAKEQKLYIEELEACFTSASFSSSNLLPADSGIHESAKIKEYKSATMSTEPDPCLSSDVLSTQSQPLLPGENYLSSVGSQDFLLPHASIKTDQSSQCFSVSSFTSDAAADASVIASNEISSEHNDMLSHEHEINSPNIGLFDLHTDDTQGTDNSSFINNIENLDELMDLDQYFEGR